MLPLRTKYYSALLATGHVLASGCHKQSPAIYLEQSDTNEAFDIAQAMKMLYGNYDVKTRTSAAALPKEKSSFPTSGEEQMTIRMLFSAFSRDAGAQSFVLVTYAVPASKQDFDCHACAPTIGMAVFSQKGLKWSIDASNRAVTSSPEWGKPPTDIQLVQVGPNRRAVQFIDVGGGQGETTAMLQLLIPWNGTVERGLQQIIADDNKGGCDSRGGLPCYANHRSVKFIRNDDVEFYDLELKLTGTDFPLSDTSAPMRARKVQGLQIFKFENGKYVQVSRQGDLTSVEDFMQKRKGKT
jgi:hypothetical protein